MQLHKLGLFFLCILGFSVAESSDRTSKLNSLKRFEVKASGGRSIWVDPKVIRGVSGLEALFTPKEFFANYRALQKLKKRAYIDIDLERELRDIFDNNIDVILPLYKLLEQIKNGKNIGIDKAANFIANSAIGNDENALRRAKKLVDQQYFHDLFNDVSIIRNLSICALQKRLVQKNGLIQKIMFSPMKVKDDETKIEETIVWLINAENKSIKIASYYFTNDNIVDTLRDAKDRGVEIQVLTDNNERSIEMLKNYHFPFRTWKKKHHFEQMHHKFILFGDNIYASQIVAHGSYNMTNNANRQPENMMFTNDSYVYSKFLTEFKKLMDNSQVELAPSQSDGSSQLSLYDLPLSQEKEELSAVGLIENALEVRLNSLMIDQVPVIHSAKRQRRF